MKFIQAGVDRFGRSWLEILFNTNDVEISGLVDINTDALDNACRTFNFNSRICFSNLDEALSSVKADALLCVTPPDLHKEFTIKAMESGLDVITEKPMASSLSECMAMLETSRRTGRKCAVSQNYRYKKETWTLASLVKNGIIGEIGQLQADFHAGVDFGGGFRHEMEYPLIIDMSIHHFDLIRYITGLNPVSVSGQAWNPPWSNYKGDASSSVIFRMENDVMAVYNGSWCAKGQFNGWNADWLIEGSKGSLVYRQDKILHYEVPNIYKVDNVKEINAQHLQTTERQFVLNDFIESVKHNRRPLTDVFDNIHSISMVFAAEEAVKTRRNIQIMRY